MSGNWYTQRANIRLPLPHKEGVEYRSVVGFPGYLIGSDGSVLSGKSGSWKPIKVFERGGYFRAGLSRDSKCKVVSIHHLLLEAFVGERPAGKQCRHLDGNALNNDLSNLCWGTAMENAQDRERHGTVCHGTRQPTAAFTESEVARIMQRLAAGENKIALAKEYGVAQNTIYGINNGTKWKHVPAPAGRYPIAPDLRKIPGRKVGVRPKGYKLKISEAERERRRRLGAWFGKQLYKEGVPPPN